MKAFGTFVIAAVFSAAAAMIPAQASAGAEGTRVGSLTCTKTGDKVSLLIHSRTPLTCTFSNGDGTEVYQGESGIALGFDMQWEETKEVVFIIVAPSTDYRIGSYALEGTYVGAKGSAAVGVGLGTNVLIGGGNKSFSLQPVSVEGSTGFGAAAGVGYLSLKGA